MAQPFSAFYAASGMCANEFLPFGFGSADDRRARVVAAAQRPLAPEVLALLREQNARLPSSAAREGHLAALARPGTVVIATGQQVGLFLGPLYTVYKAASAIVIARALTAETGVRCVPLFWLQTEDHDFEEIASCSVPLLRGAPLHLTLKGDPELGRCSLGDRRLGRDIEGLIDQVETALEGQPFVAEVVGLLRHHYRPGTAPGRAFAGVLAQLFADDGLLILDPRCLEVARLARPIIGRALRQAPQLEQLLTSRSVALAEAGFDEQIQLRAGSPLAFFHVGSPTGPRHRLIRRGDAFVVPGSNETVSGEELDATLEREPLRFSTSALLRPLLQDALLPTAVYVGGAAEVSYFAQLAPLYAAFEMTPPLVAERSHLCLIPARSRSLLEKLGLTPADLDKPRDLLLRKIASPTASSPGPAWLVEFERHLDTLATEVPTLDATLKRAIDRTRGTVRHSVEKLARKHQRAVLSRDQVLSERLERLDAWLRPGGTLQERVHSFPAFAAKVGLSRFHDAIMAAIDPFKPSLREVEL